MRDALAWDMAHPEPSKEISAILSPSRRRNTSHWSPHEGLSPWADRLAVGIRPRFRGLRLWSRMTFWYRSLRSADMVEGHRYPAAGAGQGRPGAAAPGIVSSRALWASPGAEPAVASPEVARKRRPRATPPTTLKTAWTIFTQAVGDFGSTLVPVDRRENEPDPT